MVLFILKTEMELGNQTFVKINVLNIKQIYCIHTT